MRCPSSATHTGVFLRLRDHDEKVKGTRRERNEASGMRGNAMRDSGETRGKKEKEKH